MTKRDGLLYIIIRFFLTYRLFPLAVIITILFQGYRVIPFKVSRDFVERNPVHVNAVPNLGENQQIVFTSWPGRSPRDIEDQITYPLTVSLLGIPGVKTIRSNSFFGYSSIYIIFKDDIEFYWSRTRILEKLASLNPHTLPEGVSPVLGPDATALGQVFWYTIEGHDLEGNPTGGWELDELRSVQDWQVRYALQSVDGVAEVSSVGGYNREYQIEVNPEALKAYNVSFSDLIKAVRNSNIDVGARTLELNNIEYIIRGKGFIESISDIENTVVRSSAEGVPILIKHIAIVTLGPALRRGVLEKNGSEVVGGVVTVRYMENPRTVITALKEKIEEISAGLPEKILSDGTKSKLRVIPFYDRSTLIDETVETLRSALLEEVCVTVIVIIVMLGSLTSSMLVSAILPLSILLCFILMKLFSVEANIVALSGIAIAIGTMIDVGIVMSQSIHSRIKLHNSDDYLKAVLLGAHDVGGALLTSLFTTVVSFLPVFTMTSTEGKLFVPLAFTKTFAILSAGVLGVFVLPAGAYFFFNVRSYPLKQKTLFLVIQVFLGAALCFWYPWAGGACCIIGVLQLLRHQGVYTLRYEHLIISLVVVCSVLFYLTTSWMPLGYLHSFIENYLFVGLLLGGTLSLFLIFERFYPSILSWTLLHKRLFLLGPLVCVVLAVLIWSRMGKEFMPPFDEGQFLYMPSTLPHASMGEALDQLQELTQRIRAIPEVSMVVGKLGRAESPLDPAPISMFEILVSYKPEFSMSEKRVEKRLWRTDIESKDDIWSEIQRVARVPGVTGAPYLQPIAARVVMLQSGMRAPSGIKITGPNIADLEETGLRIERILKEVASIDDDSVMADRVLGKPYLEINIHRDDIARFGLSIKDVQDVLEAAIGGMTLTTTVEGRERYNVRVRYPIELRNSLDDIRRIRVTTPGGQHVPLGDISSISFTKRAQVIKSEDGFPVSYVVFDKKSGHTELRAVSDARSALEDAIESGQFHVPHGVSFRFVGTYQNQLRAQKKLYAVVPMVLLLIFLILYFQFGSVPITLFIFSGVFVAWSGGFIALWFFNQPWLYSFVGASAQTYNLSTAVWVGFLALFGIATDDGVLISTKIQQKMLEVKPSGVEEVRQVIVAAGTERIKPALLTTATTLLAFFPVLSANGRGADLMIPMAIPCIGGLCLGMLTVFVVPVLFSFWEEYRVKNC